MFPLFVAQSFHRIDPRSTDRRQHAGTDRDRADGGDRRRDNAGVVCLGLKEERGEKLTGAERERQAQAGADTHHPHDLPQDVAADAVRRRRDGRPSDSARPTEAEERMELGEDGASAVRKALASLPAEQRRIVELAYFQGMSQSEMAAALGLPLGTVKTRLRLGMQKLRKLLENET